MSLARAERLEGVLPALVRVVERIPDLVPFEVIVIEGVRTLKRQQRLYAQGRTTDQLRAAGIVGIEGKPHLPKVTWTLNSKHILQADGYGHAVDLAPMNDDGSIDWNDLKKFDAIAFAMFRSASADDLPIRWGADWDGDGVYREKGESDSPHFEVRV